MKKAKSNGHIKISDLLPDPRNPRIHGKRNLEQIQNSLQKFGAARSIVIDEKGQSTSVDTEPVYVAVSLQRLADMGLSPKLVKS